MSIHIFISSFEVSVGKVNRHMRVSKPVWIQIFDIKRTAPVIYYTLLIYFIAELLTIFILPVMIPDHYYLRLYLHDHAKERTILFQNDNDPFNVRNDLLGWHNRFNSQHDKWHVDEFGSRTTFPLSKQPTKPNRILFIGSSLINGGPHVWIEESVSALIEDSVTEAINFGVMRYSLDQCYLAYSEKLYEYQPDILVVEFGRDPASGLINQYIPFRNPEAHGMPYVKPRFELDSGELKLVSIPPWTMFDSLMDNSEFLNWLERHDGFYGKFKEFQHFGVLPLSRFIWHSYEIIEKELHFSRGNEEMDGLLNLIITKLLAEAFSNNTRIIFLSYPHLENTFIPRWRQIFPDYYGILISELSALGYDIIDCREILRQSGRSTSELYQADMRHMTPAANKLIAEKLKERILEILSE
ncbi:MAG: hypothetical protein ABIC39_03340 [Pseudomonadota bacterium]